MAAFARLSFPVASQFAGAVELTPLPSVPAAHAVLIREGTVWQSARKPSRYASKTTLPLISSVAIVSTFLL